jgi:hypothetical protein
LFGSGDELDVGCRKVSHLSIQFARPPTIVELAGNVDDVARLEGELALLCVTREIVEGSPLRDGSGDLAHSAVYVLCVDDLKSREAAAEG